MTGKCLQIFRLTAYPGRKWFKWVLVYPPQKPGESKDLPDTVKRKEDMFGIMGMYILGSVPDWMPTQFKIIHPCGRSCLRVLWRGKVWRDGKVVLEQGKKSDLLGEPPFELK